MIILKSENIKYGVNLKMPSSNSRAVNYLPYYQSKKLNSIYKVLQFLLLLVFHNYNGLIILPAKKLHFLSIHTIILITIPALIIPNTLLFPKLIYFCAETKNSYIPCSERHPNK